MAIFSGENIPDNKERKDRVLFVVSQPLFDWRGSPIRIFFDLQALSDMGYAVDVITLPLGLEKDIPNVNIVRIKNYLNIKSISIGPSFTKIFFDIMMLWKVLQLCVKNKYVLIHTAEDTGLIGLIFAKLFGTKHVFEKHSDPFSYKNGLLKNIVLFLYAQVERFVIKNSDAVITTGPGSTELIKNYVADGQLYTIPDVASSLRDADPVKVQEIKTQLSLHGYRTILYVGSFAVYQGIDLLFDTIAIILRKYSDIKFVVIGGNAEEIEWRKRWLIEQGLQQDNVVFPGMIPPDELPNYLGCQDILLSPRIQGKNSPLKALDYMKAGKAIVATDIEANRCILNEQTAIFAKPDAGDFSQKIITLLDDPQLLLKLAKAARQEFDKNYRFDLFRKRIGQCYVTTAQKAYSHRTVFSWLLLGLSVLMAVDCLEFTGAMGEGLVLAEDS
jgi:glycosyltransferase involved in cell wall biosynthesis